MKTASESAKQAWATRRAKLNETPAAPVVAPVNYANCAAEFRLCVVRQNETPAASCSTPEESVAYWNANIAPNIDGEKEHLVVLMLDTKLKLKGHVFVSIGTLNECLASPREIFRPLIVGACHSFILMHNHPSGDATPSDADRRMTMRIKECANLMQINLLDHVVVGKTGHATPHFSFRSAGVI
jgi:DNA repair protein RadC